MVFIAALEQALSRAAGREVVFDKIYEPIKPGDVPATYASTELLQEAVGFKPGGLSVRQARAYHIVGGNPTGKSLANYPIASLGGHGVIHVSKRRQRTSRLEAKAEAIEPRNPYNGKA